MKKTLIFAAAFFVAQLAGALTLSEIRTEIRVRVKDANASRQRYTDAQLNAMANEAQRDINNAAWVVAESTAMAIVSGTTFYTLPDPTIALLRVSREYRTLKEVTLDKQDADFMGGSWYSVGGVPTSYYQDITNPGQIGLYPWPSGTSSTGTLRIDYISQPTDLSSDSDEPFLGVERYRPYHDLFVFYPCYRIFLIENDQRAATFRQEYESRLQLMRDRVGRKPNYNPGLSSERR